MNQSGLSQFNQARIEWAIRLRYSPMPDLDMDRLATQINAFRIGELRTVGKTWELMLERDGELAINSDKRKADSAGLDWQITSDGSPDGDKHAAALQYFYNNLSATKALDQDATGVVDELIYQTLSAVDYYYSAHEILLRVDNPAAKEITAEFRHTPVWFFEARRGYLGYLKHIFDLYGQPCIAGEWLTAVNLGWMRPLSMAFAAKWISFREWQVFAQRYGSGFLEGITDAQRDSTEWNLAAQALNQLSSDGNVLHNKGTEFKFLDQPAKNQLPFEPIVELVDRLYAKCYRGVDLATGSRGNGATSRGNAGQGTSANAVGASVQREESGILLVRDAKWVSGVFNDRIDRPILRYLFNEEPRAWFTLMPPLNDTTAEDLQALRTLVPMGMRVALKEVYQRFRWSAPNAGEPCLMAPASVASGQSSVEETPGQPGGNGQPTTDNGPRTTDKQPDVQSIPALTTEATPIAPGADPARNPGLLPRLNPSTLQPFNGASRQMPDTQVDSSAFWSRTALAPRGADGQVLPMPSLGYALPNASLIERLNDLTNRGLGHTRAAQSLQREIQRQQALSNQRYETPHAPLPNDFDPDQPRDEDGRWTTETDASNAKINKSPGPLLRLPSGPVTIDLADHPNSGLTLTPEEIKRSIQTMPWEGFHGTASDYIALHPNDQFLKTPGESWTRPSAADIGKGFGTAGRMLSGGLADLGETITGSPTHENFSAAIHGEPMPMIQESKLLPTPLRILERGSQGLIESVPKIGAVAGLQAAGVPAPVSAGLIFGTTEQGFDPKQAVIAAVLPIAGKYSGAITEAIASKAGVSSQTALQMINKIGGASGAAALVSADQLREIAKLPPEKRKDAIIDAVANVGSSFLLGTLGESERSEESGNVPIESTFTKDFLDAKYRRIWLNNTIRSEIWERSKAADGNVYDPSGVEIKPEESWQAGHRPGHKFSDAQRRAAVQNMDAETWKSYQRDPDIYRPEKARTNLGHRHESDI